LAPGENVNGVNDARRPLTSEDGRGQLAAFDRDPLRGTCGGGIRAAAAAALLAASAPRDARRRGLLACFAADGKVPGVDGANIDTLADPGVLPPVLKGDAPKDTLRSPGVEAAGVATLGVAALGVTAFLGLATASGAAQKTVVA
jgi:hypothetical protein